MKIDLRSRRAFLTGGGAVLAVPFLSSLLPRAARAQLGPAPVRYVQVMHPYGMTTKQFYGDLVGTQQAEEFVRYTPLADVEGPLSRVVGDAFTPYKSKFNLLHGLDVISRNANHQYCYATCASGYDVGLDGDRHPPFTGQESLDVLMSRSSAVYPDDTPAAQRLVVVSPAFISPEYQPGSFSWQRNASGEIERVVPTTSTLALSDLLADGFSDETTTDRANSETALLNAVYGDYQRIRDDVRLGSQDRQRLEAYMALLADRARTEEQAIGCSAPDVIEEADIAQIVQNQFKLLTAAMLCGRTRVASIVIEASAGYDVRHAEHHDVIANSDDVALLDDFERCGRWVADLIGAFDAAPTEQGTLLDESVIYFTTQYGNARGFGDAHRSANMPVLIAGSAGGRWNTGYYVDYRMDGHLEDDVGRGVPINNLLVTLMSSMGLTPGDWETPGRVGYGDYTDEFFETGLRPEPERWSSDEGRRATLPFVFNA